MCFSEDMLISILKMPVVKLCDNEKLIFVAVAMKCPGTKLSYIENKPMDNLSFNPYDIRYWILNNHNWTDDEKAILKEQFYYDKGLSDIVSQEWKKDEETEKANTLKQSLA